MTGETTFGQGGGDAPLPEVLAENRRLKAIANALPGMVAYWDADLCCHFANKNYLEWFGRSPEELLGTSLRTLLGEHLYALNEPFIRGALAGREQCFERTLTKADGTIGYTLAHYIPDVGADGVTAGFYVLVSDVTPLKRALLQVAAGEERLRRLYEATPALLHSVDAHGYFTLVSDAWLAKFGYAREEVIGRHTLEFMSPNSQKFVRDVMQPAIFEAGGCRDVECEIVTKSGEIVDVRLSAVLHRDADGSVRGLSVLEDITARKRAESTVRESEARYRMLAESTSDIVIQLDSHLRRRYISPACHSVLGYRPEELIAKSPGELLHPSELSGLRELLSRLLAGQMPGDNVTVTCRFRHSRGHWVWLEASVSLVRAPDTDAAQCLIASLRDVTERRRILHDLEVAKAGAEKAAQVQGEFVANVSHELRTPLTGILGIHEILRDEPTLDPRHRRYIEMAHDAGRSLLAIINDVLDFSKIEAGQVELETIPFELNALVESCRDLGRQDARKKSLRLDAYCDEGPIVLKGDPTRLRQVLLNLITNATKFTESGSVRIDARFDRSANRLRVAVTDSGIGIPEDKLPLLFRRFSQADGSVTRRYGGTGLGLAISKFLVTLMNGEIGVTSEVGKGSTFWFEIPAVLAEGAIVRREPVSTRSSRGAPHRLLLAEDYPVNREIIAAALERHGYRVTVVDNGAAAVETLGSGAPYDAILMDVQMPVMDGLSAARAIRSREAAAGSRRTPIIALTANAIPEEIRHCREAGMDAHVAKPIDWSALAATIEQVIPSPHQGWTPPRAPRTQTVVLESKKLEDWVRVVGPERTAKLLKAFMSDLTRWLHSLERATPQELSARAHSILSAAGQLGFDELAKICAELSDEAESRPFRDRVRDLRDALARAVGAGKTWDGVRRVA